MLQALADHARLVPATWFLIGNDSPTRTGATLTAQHPSPTKRSTYITRYRQRRRAPASTVTMDTVAAPVPRAERFGRSAVEGNDSRANGG